MKDLSGSLRAELGGELRDVGRIVVCLEQALDAGLGLLGRFARTGRKARASCDRLEVLDFACLRLEPGLLVGDDRAQSRLGCGGLALHFLDPAAERKEVCVIAGDEHVLVRAVGAQRDHGRFGRSLAGGLGVGCLDSNEGDDRQSGEDRGGERLLLEP